MNEKQKEDFLTYDFLTMIREMDDNTLKMYLKENGTIITEGGELTNIHNSFKISVNKELENRIIKLLRENNIDKFL